MSQYYMYIYLVCYMYMYFIIEYYKYMYFIIIEYYISITIRHVQYYSTNKTHLVILISPITTDSFSCLQSSHTHSHISNHHRFILMSPIITNSFSFSSIPNMQIGYGLGVEKVLSSLVKDERFVCLFVRDTYIS